ncbi:MAG: tetratricopeptide repeat protein [Proteobacteria bacterium]|nr:tetratricopeptide repeat protein [Pseudomonadota bacterium]
MRHLARAAGVLLAALVLLQPALTHAAPDDPEAMLREAERFYENLEYESALRVLITVQQLKELTPIQRARAYLYMGVAFTALGRAENAVQAFVEVLKIRSDFRLPDGVSPSIRAMFSQALKRQGIPDPSAAAGAAGAPAGAEAGGGGGEGTGQPVAGSAVEIVAKSPRRVTAGRPVTIALAIDDPRQQLREVVVRWRRYKGPDYSTIHLRARPGQERLEATIPAQDLGTEAGRILYYVEARDADGNVLARDGDDEQPRGVDVGASGGPAAAAGSARTSRRWLWWAAGAGGVVALAGGVIAAVVLAGGGGGGPGANADVTLTIQ